MKINKKNKLEKYKLYIFVVNISDDKYIIDIKSD